MSSIGDTRFEAAVSPGADEVIIAISGEIDCSSADGLWSAIEQALAERTRVVVDLTNTEFMDSSGLAMLVRAHRQLGSDGSLTIRTGGGTIRKVLEVSGLTRTLAVDPPRLTNTQASASSVVP